MGLIEDIHEKVASAEHNQERGLGDLTLRLLQMKEGLLGLISDRRPRVYLRIDIYEGLLEEKGLQYAHTLEINGTVVVNGIFERTMMPLTVVFANGDYEGYTLRELSDLKARYNRRVSPAPHLAVDVRTDKELVKTT